MHSVHLANLVLALGLEAEAEAEPPGPAEAETLEAEAEAPRGRLRRPGWQRTARASAGAALATDGPARGGPHESGRSGLATGAKGP